MEGKAALREQGLRVFSLTRGQFRTGESLPPGELFDLSERTLADVDSLDDLAAEVLLKEGVALDVSWQRNIAGGSDVVVAGGVAVVLTQEISDAVVEETFEFKPRVVIFLEDGFAGQDAVKANAFTNAKSHGITMKTV